MTKRVFLFLTSVFAVVSASTMFAAEPTTSNLKAASEPASTAAPVVPPPAANAPLFIKVSFGDKRPGTPRPARLQIPELTLDIATDERGELTVPKVQKGKVHLKAFVAGADPCEVSFDVAGDKPTTVKLFVPKRAPGGKCERIKD